MLTPHIAGVTRESNERVSSLIARKVAEALLARRTDPRMPTMTLCRVARPRARARCSAQARRARWRTRRRDALVDAEAQGLASHGTGARWRNTRRICATAAPTAPRVAERRPRARRRRARRCPLRPRVSRVRAGRRRSDPAGARIRRLVRRCDEQPSFRRRGVASGARCGCRHGRASRSATRRRRCPPRAAGGRCSAPIPIAAVFPRRDDAAA